MVGWFTSLSGTLVVSILAILSFTGYSLLVFRYVIEELMPGIPGAVLQTLIVLVILGVWIGSLFPAYTGSRRSLMIALVCTSLPFLFSLYDLLFHSPIRFGWPLVQISVWSTLVICLAAIASLIYQLVFHAA